jgi:hypothetical protein
MLTRLTAAESISPRGDLSVCVGVPLGSGRLGIHVAIVRTGEST